MSQNIIKYNGLRPTHAEEAGRADLLRDGQGDAIVA